MEKTICGSNTTECGGSWTIGDKCYCCIAYDPKLDGRLGGE